jgi:putative tryptophan/tyrosine transport system substrate-binding protein
MSQSARRRFVLSAGALLAMPRIAAAQPARVARIGFLTNGTVASTQGQLDSFRRGLKENGYVDAHHFIIESRFAEGRLDRLPELVADLLAQRIDVIYAPSGIAAQAAKKSGTTVPIVFAFAPDPVGQGFGASFSRPGGSMTGLTSTHTELSAKRIELLKETFPGIRRIAVLYYLAPSGAGVAEQLAETERAAKLLGIAIVREESPRVEDFERAFASIHKQRPDALIVIENPVFFTHRVRLAALAAALRMPAMYNVSEYVHAGGLMSYGASYADLSRRAASYVVKILNGHPPGELPIERPIKFELAINTRTATAMGLRIPPSVLLRADETIGG